MKKLIRILFVLLSFASCREAVTTHALIENANFSIGEFHAMNNYEADQAGKIRTIELDYSRAIEDGFIIPTERQVKGGYFSISFSIKNNTKSSIPFAYKIYFQNESYKFNELNGSGKQNDLASENFYGTWDDSTTFFRLTSPIPADGQFHMVSDSVRILGNPRHEEECFEDGINRRWRRNPRVGKYSFMLAVSLPDSVSLSAIPSYIQNICIKKDGVFISPYYYFLYGEAKANPSAVALVSSDTLKVIAHPDLGSGIYINGGHFNDDEIRKGANANCGNDTSLYFKAPFAQFIHYIDESTKLENIPVIADVLKDSYSKREYNWNRSFYRKEELISTTPKTAELPCQTVYSDPSAGKIVIHNPGNKEGKWRKENVGIISRHGMCYGKIRVKAKLSSLLNKENMWNGLTNAIWLINQGGGDGRWNLRRPCRKEGYMATYWGGRDDKRVDRVGYSEIDFEILKTPAYCPDQDFPPVYKLPKADKNNESSWNVPWPGEITKHDADITVACTNWDMACWEPENYGVGCNPVTYGNQTFQAHRWDHWYRALTEKSYENNDSLFESPFYYFEIDWRPNEIIWRIGPSPEQMRIVGYMDDKVSSIPNNQMLLIITQEFHNTKWWPGSPYQQNNIPFPLNDIFGEIYEVVIE